MAGTTPLWTPTQEQINMSNLACFMSFVNQTFRQNIQNYPQLYAWSIKEPANFWLAVWRYCGVVGDLDIKQLYQPKPQFFKSRFFANSFLNYAENLLQTEREGDALVFWGEDQIKTRLSRQEIKQKVTYLAHALQSAGVRSGDRVAAYLPNMPETVIGMLAAASIGAVWSSCSPDFGSQGVLDRFGQIEPKILFVCDGYYYKGKKISISDKVETILKGLPTVEHVIQVPYIQENLSVSDGRLQTWEQFCVPSTAALRFERVPFDHPLFILYSSGTTGAPKCIVHGHGGTLLQHLKEHDLHCNIRPDDRVFYFTTCGWMMWNWLVSALASEATLLLFDGNPFYPDWSILFQMAAAEKATFFGTSAKYLDSLQKEGARPRERYDLSSLRTIASTGSPLSPESFDYVYDAVAPQVNLASISGGTDIVSCFMLGCFVLPVWRGEIQTAGLGMKVDVFNDQGQSVAQEKGELVCTHPFPSMPVCFWNDPGDKRYESTYFSRFPNVWAHGDYVEKTAHQGFIIYGRSDAVLNPGGVRIGTAEIYRQVQQIPEVLDSVAVGQEYQGDVRVILFVVLKPGAQLDAELAQRLKQQIRQNASPRHVPDLILEVPDIPRTISGKISELAVTAVIHGRPVKNTESLANPDSLHYFENRPELKVAS